MSSNPAKRTALANLSTRRSPDDDQPEVPQREVRLPGALRRQALKPLPTEEILKNRDAPPPPNGYRYTMDGRLVPAEETELSIEDPEAQALFCDVVEVTGSLRAACDSLGIKSMAKVKRYIDRNPDFYEDVECAAERHRQSLYAHAVQRATVGYMKPIVGGRNKDEIVGYERVVSDSLLTLLLKRHFVEFRETKPPAASTTVNVNLGNTAKKLSREQRDQMRQLIQGDPPPQPDPSGIIDIDEPEGSN